MPEGYTTVTDPGTYEACAALASEAMKTYGAKVLARGGRREAVAVRRPAAVGGVVLVEGVD